MNRFAAFSVITSVFILLLIWKFVDIMLLQPSPGVRSIQGRAVIERGPILDRNGKILAIQTRLYSATAWIPSIRDKDNTARILSSELNLDFDTLYRELQTRSGFMYIKRKITPTETSRIQEIMAAGELPGISLEPEFGRSYPEKKLASHVLGFVGTDNIGLDGIELTYNTILSPIPEPGEVTIFGNQVYLTLDLNIQYFTEKLAREAYMEHAADAVMIMVMDAKNGDILGWSSFPSYDPNMFSVATAEEKRNLPSVYAYEPGSVFKIFSLASIMDLGGISPASSFFCPGYYEHTFPNGETIRINCLGNHGNVRPEEILKFSCNAGTAYASDTVDRISFYEKLSDFGFGSRLHLPFPGETAGSLRRPNLWSGRSKPTIAIGQELSVSAIQMVTAATALANDGMVLEPHIIKKIVSSEGEVLEEARRQPVRQAVSPQTARSIVQLMEPATLEGTGRLARLEGLRISTKTGTAEKIDPRTGRYSAEAFIASVLAIIPTEDPRLIVYVVIDHPKAGTTYGGRIATPIVRDLTADLVTYLGIERATQRIIDHPGVVTVRTPDTLDIGEKMPDLIGFSKRQLLPLIAHEYIEVRLHGEGWVIHQIPLPGTPITEGMTVQLELR